MATYNTSVFNKGIKLRPTDQIGPAEATISFTYPIGALAATGDVIKFVKLPAGLQVLSVRLVADGALATSALTASLGTTAVPAAYLAATAFGYTNKTAIGAGAGDTPAFATDVVPLIADGELIATLAGTATGATSSAARSITLTVKYQYAYPDRVLTGIDSSGRPYDPGDFTFG